MDGILLWILRAAAALAALATIVRMIWLNDQVDRERYQDEDQPYFRQKKTVGSPFGARSFAPRWQVWLGVAAPFLLFALVLLLVS